MEVTTQMEFSVEMTCDSCVNAVKSSLAGTPVKLVSVNADKQQVIVESSLSWQEVQDVIEVSGKRAALVGYGSNKEGGNLGAAVAELSGPLAKGVVRIVQLNKDLCLFDGIVDGLQPGDHGLSVHEYGDLSRGCDSCGDHFNPSGQLHGDRKSEKRHLGDLGNITAKTSGRSTFRFTDNRLKVWDMIGRSLVIHEHADDLGRGGNDTSKHDGNAGRGISCGIIARSAGLMQNLKRFCACDGVPIWEERNVPIVGKERQKL